MNLPDLNLDSGKMSHAGQETYDAARASVAHLRAQTSKGFLLEVECEIRGVEKSADKDIILSEAKKVCAINWALLIPFFNAAKKIAAADSLLMEWSALARQLAVYDIDSAITFLNRSPVALENFGSYVKLILWGKQGLDAWLEEKFSIKS